MLNSKFEDLKNYLADKKILITTHDLVDIDGFVSCFVLKFFFKLFYEKNEVFILFQEISKATKNFIDKINNKFPKIKISYLKSNEMLDFDLIIIMDTNNLEQVNFDVLRSGLPFLFIDHHTNLNKNYKGNLESLNIILDEFSSTAEIIFELFKYYNLEIKLPYKYLLIAAILTDSGFFRHGNNDTIKRVSKLLDYQIDYQDVLITLKNNKEISEKLAIIKGLKRVELIRYRGWLIGITNVGSFEATVANSLIQIGFDVGVVYSDKKSNFRISTRASKNICLNTGLHLGEILGDISNEYEVSGGGHNGAASLNGSLNGVNISKSILDKIIYKIKLILNN